jgi:tetratricopeptide (TPR) repeat protein
MTALRKEPEARYHSVEHLAGDVRRHLAGAPLTIRGGDRLYRLRKLLRRHWLPAASAAALAALLTGYAVTTRLQSREIARQRDAAERQADRAASVLGFFSQVIASRADPRVLDLAAERVDELAPRPDVYGEVLQILGELNLGFGRPREALPLLEQAVPLRAALYGEGSEEALSARTALAQALQQNGRLSEARAEYERIAARARGPQPAARGRLASVQWLRGELAMTLGDYDEALACLQEAAAIRREQSAEAAPELLARQGDGATEPEVVFPGRYAHLQLARSLRSLADLETRRGALAEAQKLVDEAQALDRLQPGYPPSLAETLFVTARLQRTRGDLEAAERTLDEVLALSRAYPGREKEFVSGARLERARVLLALGREDEAAAQLAAARPAFAGALGRDPSLGVERWHVEGLLYRYQGDSAAARRALERGATLLQELGLAQTPRMAELQLDLGRWALEEERWAAADRSIRAAEAILAGRLLPQHPSRIEAERLLNRLAGRPRPNPPR